MSNKPKISAIAALGRNTRVLGKDGDLVWKIDGDLPRFKKLTTNHPIIMGRKTYESIGRALPNRKNIVVTRSSNFNADGVVVVNSKEDALTEAGVDELDEIFIIGGGEIYKMFLPDTDRLYLTLVDSDDPGDTFFPDYPEFNKIIKREEVASGDLNTEFIILEKST